MLAVSKHIYSQTYLPLGPHCPFSFCIIHSRLCPICVNVLCFESRLHAGCKLLNTKTKWSSASRSCIHQSESVSSWIGQMGWNDLIDWFPPHLCVCEAYHLCREETDWFDQPRDGRPENGHERRQVKQHYTYPSYTETRKTLDPQMVYASLWLPVVQECRFVFKWGWDIVFNWRCGC